MILRNTYNYCVHRTYIEGLAITHTISIHKNPEKKYIKILKNASETNTYYTHLKTEKGRVGTHYKQE